VIIHSHAPNCQQNACSCGKRASAAQLQADGGSAAPSPLCGGFELEAALVRTPAGRKPAAKVFVAWAAPIFPASHDLPHADEAGWSFLFARMDYDGRRWIRGRGREDGEIRLADGCKLIDLADGLLPVIEANLGKSFDEQLAAWREFYANHAPALPERLYGDYSDEEGGWLPIARDRVWPMHAERMGRMKAANKAIRETYADIYRLAGERLGFTGPLVLVTYVGIGNGAGWATQWEGLPAVLLGIENIAELNWHERPSVCGLLSHEIGHLFMTSVRGAEATEKLTEDPHLCLFEEGFAQHCEHVIVGSDTWHCASQPGWVEWCAAHEPMLAGEFLRRVHDRKLWREFFGSWFEIDGRIQTGYFLGCRMVERMNHRMSLCEIAGLPEQDVKRLADEYLHSFQ
jgi:hypothetical protein